MCLSQPVMMTELWGSLTLGHPDTAGSHGGAELGAHGLGTVAIPEQGSVVMVEKLRLIPGVIVLSLARQAGNADGPFMGELSCGSIDKGLPQVPHGGS